MSCGGFAPSSPPPLSSPLLPALSGLPSLVTASLSYLVAGQPRPHSPATSSAPSISLRSSVELVVDDRSLSESFDVLFIRIPCRLYTVLFAVVTKRFPHREEKAGREAATMILNFPDFRTLLDVYLMVIGKIVL